MTPTIGSGPTVGRLGFGAMRITGPGVWGPPADESEATAPLRRAADKRVGRGQKQLRNVFPLAGLVPATHLLEKDSVGG